jgi:hypothetical protein
MEGKRRKNKMKKEWLELQILPEKPTLIRLI